jgi:hypothetical protein
MPIPRAVYTEPRKARRPPRRDLPAGSPDPDCSPQVSDWGSSVWWSCAGNLAADWLQSCWQDIGVVHVADHLEHGHLERDNWGEATAHFADHDAGGGESHSRFFLRPQIDVHRQGRKGDFPTVLNLDSMGTCLCRRGLELGVPILDAHFGANSLSIFAGNENRLRQGRLTCHRSADEGNCR